MTTAEADVVEERSVDVGTSSPFGAPYPHIDSVYKRDDRGQFILGEYSDEAFAYLADLKWRWTEKIDGTNIRLHWDGIRVHVAGKTDAAQVPAHFLAEILHLLEPPMWKEIFGEEPGTVYGEGYGPKIQNGGWYAKRPGFVAFDVRIGRWWLKPDDMEGIAAKLGFPTTPIVSTVTSLTDMVAAISEGGYSSGFASEEKRQAEGVVGTPLVPLFNRAGARVITKIKVKDFSDITT